MDIAENVKYVLKERKMTQGEFADKMGVSLRSVQYYLNGNLSLETLQRMADALDTTVEAIVSETPLEVKGTLPRGGGVSLTKLVCPHCGEEITIIAR